MLIQMIRDGHKVDVHPDMVEDYFAAGYREIENAEPKTLREAKTQAETETAPHPLDHDGDGKPGGSLPDAIAPRRRGRKPKGQA